MKTVGFNLKSSSNELFLGWPAGRPLTHHSKWISSVQEQGLSLGSKDLTDQREVLRAGRVVWNKEASVAGALTTGSPDPQL